MLYSSNSIHLEMANESHLWQITEFLKHRSLSHQHLDWSNVEDWLRQDHFYICQDHDKICGLVVIPFNADGNTWVKLLAIDKSYPLANTGREMFSICLKKLSEEKSPLAVHSLALWDWYEQILIRSNFTYQDSIITMERNISANNLQVETIPINAHQILPVTALDVYKVVEIDKQSFSPPWQLSCAELSNAISNSDYVTGVRVNDNLVAYQISSVRLTNVHLNRIAVLPEYRNQKIGSSLINDIFAHYHNSIVSTISVNTQASNEISRKLYRGYQFHETEDSIPVYIYQSE